MGQPAGTIQIDQNSLKAHQKRQSMNDTFTDRMLPRQAQQAAMFGQQSKFDGTAKGSGSIPNDNGRSELLNMPIYKTKPKEVTPILSS